MKKYIIKEGVSPFKDPKTKDEREVYSQYPTVFWVYQRFLFFFYRKTIVFEYTKEQAEETAQAIFA